MSEQIRVGRVATAGGGQQFIIGKLVSIGDTISWTSRGGVLTGKIVGFEQRGSNVDNLDFRITTDKGNLGSGMTSAPGLAPGYELNTVIGIGATEPLNVAPTVTPASSASSASSAPPPTNVSWGSKNAPKLVTDYKKPGGPGGGKKSRRRNRGRKSLRR